MKDSVVALVMRNPVIHKTSISCLYCKHAWQLSSKDHEVQFLFDARKFLSYDGLWQ